MTCLGHVLLTLALFFINVQLVFFEDSSGTYYQAGFVNIIMQNAEICACHAHTMVGEMT